MPLYFLTCIFMFWIPATALTIGCWGLQTATQHRAFWITGAAFGGLSLVMEYVYLWLDLWSFSTAHDPLLGINLWGAPIEEFVFWFGATPFVLSLYWVTQWVKTGPRRRRAGSPGGR